MKKIYYLLLLTFSFSMCDGQDDKSQRWLSDIDWLVHKIQQEHYIYKNRDLPSSFQQQLSSIKQHISTYSDERILIELQQLLYHLGDGHTYMLPFGYQLGPVHYLPVHLYTFSDGMYIIDADEKYRHLIGAHVKKLDRFDVQEMMQKMVSFVSQDNTMGATWIGPFFLRFRGMLEYFGLKKNASSVSLTLIDADGKEKEVMIDFVAVPRLRGIPKMVAPPHVNKPILYLQNIQSPYWLQSIPSDHALYFQFNQVMNAPAETLSAFAKKLGDSLLPTKASLLIIDVRHNNGGNGDLLEPLLHVIKAFEQNQKGQIVVLTGRNTFSAAQIFITKVNRDTKAIFAGEPSSSSPNFVGEENGFTLPFSGAMGSISNRYHENFPGDKRKWIEPALRLSISSKDYFGNRDPLLEAVLKKYAER